jgi:hypothetical protein
MTYLRINQELDGCCGGVFDNCDDEVHVEAIGDDWVVVRGASGPQFFVGAPEDLLQYARQ